VNLTPAEMADRHRLHDRGGQDLHRKAARKTILLSDVLGPLRHGECAARQDAARQGHRHQPARPVLPRRFHRTHQLGDSIIAKPDSPQIVFYGRVHDLEGRGIPHAKVEVWQTDEHGYYDMQMYGDEKMDMRGTFIADAEGNFHFRTVHPLGYYIPMDGPVGRLIRAQSRAGCRPAHIHFLITADGYRELVTSLYEGRDQYIDSDVVFGVSSSLIIEAKPDKASPFPELEAIHYDFGLARAAAAGRGTGGGGSVEAGEGGGRRALKRFSNLVDPFVRHGRASSRPSTSFLRRNARQGRGRACFRQDISTVIARSPCDEAIQPACVSLGPRRYQWR